MDIMNEYKADGWGEYDFYICDSSQVEGVVNALTRAGFMVGGGEALNRVTIATDTKYRSDIGLARSVITGYVANAQ